MNDWKLPMIAFLTALLSGRGSAGALPSCDVLGGWLGKRPGAVIMAHVGPRGVVFRHAGTLSPDHPHPPTPDTCWEIGSVTKVFTGILLADGEQAGKLSRHDPASKWLLPADDKDQARLGHITLLSLTTHTSGLPRLPKNLKTWFVDDPYAAYGAADLITGLRIHGPKAVPSLEGGYSNFGVGVLGEAIGRAWGKPYPDVLAERVLLPLEMRNTTLAMTGGAAPENFAPPLEGKDYTDRWTFSSMAPAGALLSTARDMAAFLQACMGLADTPLKGVLAESMKPLKPTDDSSGSVAMGWFLHYREDPVIWHNGATGGFQSFLGFRPSANEGVVILTNSGKVPNELGIRILTRKE